MAARWPIGQRRAGTHKTTSLIDPLIHTLDLRGSTLPSVRACQDHRRFQQQGGTLMRVVDTLNNSTNSRAGWPELTSTTAGGHSNPPADVTETARESGAK